MVTKLIFKPHSLSSHFLSPHPFSSKPHFSKFQFLSLLSTTSQNQAQTLISTQPLKYGPSLLKGENPSHNFQITEESEKFDEDSFTRVFDIAAIRVPSKDCFALETRLRGHLLNWPRVRNIARVPGDDFDDEFSNSSFSKSGNVDDEVDVNSNVSLNRRVYGKAEGDGEVLNPVLYRDKLANTFDSKGFVKFRNLAKMSRPKTKKKGNENEEKGETKVKKGFGRNDFVLVEVVEEDDLEEEDLSGLLGEDFKGRRKWRGSTRLLLLDERYAGNDCIDELPEAIKAVVKEDTGENTKPVFELVRCRLTLFYSYWQMSEILEALLPDGQTIPSAFESVGHIAHLNLREEHLPYKKLIAKVVLDKNKPKIQTVVNKCDAIHNDYRTMELEVLAGNRSLVATVAENGLHFQVDLAKVYWNSRLATERQRLLSCFTSKDVVCDVFSGVGPIAISVAKKVKYVYANDLNPQAVEYLERNCVLNRLERKIEVSNMDGRRFIDAIFTSQRAQSITQVVMNLPKDAAEYLDAFKGVYWKQSKDNMLSFPRIHVYGFSKAQDPEFDFHERIRIALSEVAFEVEMRKVRLVAPGKWMLCASFILPESVAFAKPLIT